MADDLVVREWVWDGSGLSADSWAGACIEHNVVATTLNERTAQLADVTTDRNLWRANYQTDLVRANEDMDVLRAQLTVMTTERDAANDNAETLIATVDATQAQLTAMTAERDRLSKINGGLVNDFNSLLLRSTFQKDELTAVRYQLTASEAARGKARQDTAGEIFEWIYVNGTWIDNKLSPDAAKISRHCFALAEPGKAGEP